MATEMELVRKSGAWFYLGEDRLGQGRENAKQFLAENPHLLDEVERQIKALAMDRGTMGVAKAAPTAEDGDAFFEEE
jgi:recombination protein RecA